MHVRFPSFSARICYVLVLVVVVGVGVNVGGCVWMDSSTACVGYRSFHYFYSSCWLFSFICERVHACVG